MKCMNRKCKNEALNGDRECLEHGGQIPQSMPTIGQPNVGINWQAIAENAKSDIVRLMADNAKLIEEREAFCLDNKELRVRLETTLAINEENYAKLCAVRLVADKIEALERRLESVRQDYELKNARLSVMYTDLLIELADEPH